MKKLTVTGLIEFKRKTSDRSKKIFVENIKLNKITPPTESGGDYWITSLSAVCNSYRQNDFTYAEEKIIELKEKLRSTKRIITKNMYQRNISILQNFKSMDLKNLRPLQNLTFLKRSTGNSVLNIKGLQIETKPSYIFTFGNKEEQKIGAIWFTAKVNGYRSEEVGMFCDMLYRFLKHNYSNKYQLIPKYCIAVDLLSGNTIDYSKIENGALSKLLSPTLEEINKFM